MRKEWPSCVHVAFHRPIQAPLDRNHSAGRMHSSVKWKGKCRLTHYQKLQGRILLEETYNALASAHGGAASILGTEAGVYVGCMYQEYADVLSRCGGKLNSASATGNSLSFMVGRHAASFCLIFSYLFTATCPQVVTYLLKRNGWE